MRRRDSGTSRFPVTVTSVGGRHTGLESPLFPIRSFTQPTPCRGDSETCLETPTHLPPARPLEVCPLSHLCPSWRSTSTRTRWDFLFSLRFTEGRIARERYGSGGARFEWLRSVKTFPPTSEDRKSSPLTPSLFTSLNGHTTSPYVSSVCPLGPRLRPKGTGTPKNGDYQFDTRLAEVPPRLTRSVEQVHLHRTSSTRTTVKRTDLKTHSQRGCVSSG